ncbi:MAG: IMP dehydrogenase, partial [Actinomycetota bacterium]
MRLLHEPDHDLTYDDVFMIPSRSNVTSRMDVDLRTSDKTGATIPLVVANMTAISGRRMAETVARRGGLTVIPQDIPLPVVSEVISWMKSRHVLFDTPITLEPHQTVADAASLIHKRAHGAIVVVEKNKPIGIVMEEDWEAVDRFTQVHRIMSKDLMVIPDSVNAREAFDLLHEKNRRLAPVVNNSGDLVGIITKTGALRATLYQPALDDNNRLRIAAAVGVNGDVKAKTEGLIKAGVDVLVVDTAHGHQEKMIEVLKIIRSLNPR